MRVLQSAILLLNLTPLSRLFRRLYASGLRRVVDALAAEPGIYAILGCGSYFQSQPTFGLSDIDLIIVFRKNVKRTDTAPAEAAGAYERTRRRFPFLGRWHEKESNLIFLSDIAAGFPLPASLRVRLKQGRIVHLYGEPLPAELADGPITASEILTELNTLLRMSLVTEPGYTGRMVFWKRMIAKTLDLAEVAGLADLAREERARAELTFLNEDDTKLFFRPARGERLFELQMDIVRRIWDALRSREATTRIGYIVTTPNEADVLSPEPSRSAVVSEFERAGRLRVRAVASVPLNIGPNVLYFSIDDPLPLLELKGDPYKGLRRLQHALARRAGAGENHLVSAEGVLFIVSRQPTYVDIVPLDPLRFAPAYAAVTGHVSGFEMPATICAEQHEEARQTFRGLATLYRRHEGSVTKLSYPCIYRERDIDVVENALRILRSHLAASPEPILIRSLAELFEHLRRQHPECADFLRELQHYRRYLYGDFPAEQVANNIYRCLHQFMWQYLRGVSPIALEPHHKHLAITVGVITRNRATDLAKMLDSLTNQIRRPDEVLVVDNGSTDRTQAVLAEFSDRLPIRLHFLSEPNIPRARNVVIEETSNEIISFIDDDCISEPEWLAAVERGFLRADNIGIVGGWVRHEPAPRPSSVDNYYRTFHHTKP